MTEWNAGQIPDQRGRVAVVTGANSGLGRVTTTELARHGARVVLAVRDTAAGERAAAAIRDAVPGADLHVREPDLASLSSVRTFAKGLTADFPAVDLLVNNAGVVILGAARTTSDGFELHLGTNLLGHFALTGLVLDALGRAEAPRVVNLSSITHKNAHLDFDDLMSRRDFDASRAYGRSKLATTVFGLELDRRLRAAARRVPGDARPGRGGPAQHRGRGPRGRAAAVERGREADRRGLPLRLRRRRRGGRCRRGSGGGGLGRPRGPTWWRCR